MFAKEIETMAVKTTNEKTYVGSFKTTHSIAHKLRVKCAKDGTTISKKVEELLKQYLTTK